MNRDDDQQIGALLADVRNIGSEVAHLRDSIESLRNSIEDLKIWRAQLIGLSFGISLITSGIISIVAILSQWK